MCRVAALDMHATTKLIRYYSKQQQQQQQQQQQRSYFFPALCCILPSRVEARKLYYFRILRSQPRLLTQVVCCS